MGDPNIDHTTLQSSLWGPPKLLGNPHFASETENRRAPSSAAENGVGVDIWKNACRGEPYLASMLLMVSDI